MNTQIYKHYTTSQSLKTPIYNQQHLFAQSLFIFIERYIVFRNQHHNLYLGFCFYFTSVLQYAYSSLACSHLRLARHWVSGKWYRKMMSEHTSQKHIGMSEVRTGRDCNRAHAQCCRRSWRLQSMRWHPGPTLEKSREHRSLDIQ